ncbi:MAG: DUF3127 domain-containing protein [Crocinitomicaceae bacterium]|nr:DUF3127 domain-containing protein [Crocinitomicaceae bacterium]
MYTLKGELKVIENTQQISDSFKKREFVVLDASGQYAQTILFQLVQDRCELLDNFKVGDNVEVTFFLRGREWTNPKDGTVRYFNSLDAWKIDPLGSGSSEAPTTADNAETFVAEGDDDLPF